MAPRAQGREKNRDLGPQKRSYLNVMELEPRQAASAGDLRFAAAQRLDWEQGVLVLAELFDAPRNADKLQGCVEQVLAQAPKPEAMRNCAQIWTQEIFGQAPLELQVQAVFALGRWLRAQPELDAPGDIQPRMEALVLALCQQEQQRLKEQDTRQSKLVLVGQLFASIAHELRNPLAVVESSVFLLRRQLQDEDPGTRHLQKITRNVNRCHEIIHDVLEMIRNAPLRTQSLTAQEIWEDLRSHCPPTRGIVWSIEAPADLKICCSPRLLRQCLLNLVSNAKSAMQGQGELRCETALVNQGQEFMFRVQDTGPGFSPALLGRSVDWLVSERADGHGLGLALAQSIAVRHGGRLEISNHEQGGAQVSVFLPHPAKRS